MSQKSTRGVGQLWSEHGIAGCTWTMPLSKSPGKKRGPKKKRKKKQCPKQFTNICILEPQTSCISSKQPLVSPHGSLLLRCAFLNSVFPLAWTHCANLGQHTSPLLLCVIQDLWTWSHLVAVVAVNLQTLTQLLARSLRVLHYSKKYIHIDTDGPSAYKLHFGECLIVSSARAKQSWHRWWDLTGPSYPSLKQAGSA